MGGAHEILARAAAWVWPAAVDHLWQSAVFAALVFGLTLLARRGPARVRHALWLVALLKFALPPALFALLAASVGLDTSQLFARTQEATAAGAGLALQLAEPAASLSNAAEGAAAGAAAAHGEVYCALTLVWVAGCASLLLVRRRRRREFLRALGAGREVYAGREFEALERARRRLGFETDARLLLSPHGAEPGVWRAREPLVVLPSSLAAHLDEEELELLLTHELAHVERRDNLIAGLQTALTCVFWFCPPVWMVGRKLVEERERACDERVLEAGGACAPYASSILKVVRFCSGWNVAGVAGAAAGPNLRRRIEEIMGGQTNHGRTAWARALPLGAAAAALALSAGAGVYSYAQSGGRGLAVAARAGGGARAGGAGVRAEAQRRGASGAAAAEIEQTPESLVNFDNSGDVPLVITEAKMRMVTREQLKRADEEGADSLDDRARSDYFLTMPSVTVANYTGKTVREVGIGFVTNGRAKVISGYAASIRPGESQTFGSEWERRNVILPGTLSDVTVRVVWVEFADGTQWGRRPSPPRPPDAPPPGSINSSRGTQPPPPTARVPSADPPAGGPTAAGNPPTGGPPPPPEPDAPAGPPTAVGGGRGGGVASAQGGAQVRGGILNRRVRSAPNPVYPPAAKAAGARGTVAVRVVIDEEGNVVEAEAVGGHPLLLGAAVEAARSAKFAPTRLNGRPVKVTGHLTYNFVPGETKQERQQQQ